MSRRFSPWSDWKSMDTANTTVAQVEDSFCTFPVDDWDAIEIQVKVESVGTSVQCRFYTTSKTDVSDASGELQVDDEPTNGGDWWRIENYMAASGSTGAMSAGGAVIAANGTYTFPYLFPLKGMTYQGIPHFAFAKHFMVTLHAITVGTPTVSVRVRGLQIRH